MERDVSDDQITALLLGIVLIGATALMGQLDGRSFPKPREEEITVRSNFWKLMKEKRSPKRLGPRYYAEYGDPSPNTRYAFDHKLAVLLAYYGNACGQDGDGIGGAAAQLGMSRTSAGRYIGILERILEGMKDEVIYFPAVGDSRAWSELTTGFDKRGGLFPDVACVFDGTIIKTRRPSDPQGFYEKSFNPAYNCLFACDYRMRFRFLGIFTGSNSDQSMWNQSTTLGANARFLCPPGVN